MRASYKTRCLNDLAHFWRWNGDLIECRGCGNSQHISLARHKFQHRSGCRDQAGHAHPWIVLHESIGAQFVEARPAS